jgi:thiosulfate dehydrogenase [quinone] large subunit
MQPPDTMQNPSAEKSPLEHSLAFLLLRIWLGLRALITGIEKFGDTVVRQQALLDESGLPDPSGIMLSVEQKAYGLSHYHAMPNALLESLQGQPLLPSFLLTPYQWILGPALILLGLTLLLGVATRVSLFLMGLLYTSLTFGLILIHQDAGIAWLGVHIALITMALLLSRHNRFCLLKRF